MSNTINKYPDDELLPISGLQHMAFCPRQCALIHLERAWAENFLTASGKVMHERVHNAPSESRGYIRTVRGLMLRSSRLGLIGIADVVEFHRIDSTEDADSLKAVSVYNELTNNSPDSDTNSVFDSLESLSTQETDPDQSYLPVQALTLSDNISSKKMPMFIQLPKKRGLWRPYPVEYKRGNPKKGNCDAVQLCAQAICLEEMLSCFIPEGALYYGQTRRREIISFDETLRQETELIAKAFHDLIDSGQTPPPNAGTKCKACSLSDDCLPDMKMSAVLNYLQNQWKEAESYL